MMDTATLIESFADFAKQKNIDRPTMIRILEDVFRSMIRKKYITDDNFDIIVNPDRGDIEIWHNRTVVDDEFEEDSFDYDPAKHIGLTNARKIDPDLQLEEEVTTPVKLDDFGRRAVLAVRQNLVSKVLELEKDNVYKKYKDRIGEVVTGEVYQ